MLTKPFWNNSGTGCIKLIFLRGHALSTDFKTEKLKECMWLYFQLDLTIFQANAQYNIYVQYVHISFHNYTQCFKLVPKFCQIYLNFFSKNVAFLGGFFFSFSVKNGFKQLIFREKSKCEKNTTYRLMNKYEIGNAIFLHLICPFLPKIIALCHSDYSA